MDEALHYSATHIYSSSYWIYILVEQRERERERERVREGERVRG